MSARALRAGAGLSGPRNDRLAGLVPGAAFCRVSLAALAFLFTVGTAAAQQADQPVRIAARPEAVAAETGPVRALDARLAGDEQRTRLVIDLSRKVEFRAFTLTNPYRVIVDLSDVTFTFEPAKVQTKRGLVSTYRYGVFAPGKARMVLDVAEPVAIDKAFVLDPAEDQPARLVLDLVKTDAASFASNVATAAEARGAPTTTVAALHGAVPDTDARPVIVLDPGHGGVDSGTTGASAYAEKNIVLDVALALRTKLEQGGRYRVLLTRSTDTFVALGERVKIARTNRAALFVSIHADALASNDGQARGASVYTLSETASDSEAARLAEVENKADLIAGVDLSEESDEVAGILFDLAQRETKNFSATFARTLVGAMKATGKIHKSPLKSAGFRVLKAHDVPSVLVELGYMSSREDLKLMTSDAWRDKVTGAMSDAIDNFFATRTAGITGSIPAAPAGK
ncbi:N-acetylmuramoyl-L-alanine amidase [Aquabacter sp. CN5-332]|uniref:N-acetylmuramoyl-L-alanine amidase n=1 Tax=Aquabacter sp. CN5-332 TaxID=3156608 RepID=UPI0032B32E82